ncbi:hypothetical protein AAVH_24324 [Aphelenchoides avenae]|nr:hypothetical protein AAVH_24324 [Aphelenchus avenae]
MEIQQPWLFYQVFGLLAKRGSYVLPVAYGLLPNKTRESYERFFTLLKTYYIGRRRNDNNRRQPLFPKELWSVHARTVGNQDRTNNHAEAAHRKLQAMLQIDHPSLWKFMESLMHVQKETDFRYEQYVRGDQNVPKRKKYREADERILKIVAEYRNREIIEYLRGIAHNFQME